MLTIHNENKLLVNVIVDYECPDTNNLPIKEQWKEQNKGKNI